MVVGEFTQEAQLLVVGGGPGGYSAAFRAAELGVPVIVADARGSLGGACLHEGCIPSKTLLHIAEIIRAARGAEPFGVRFSEPVIDVTRVREWVGEAVATLGRGLESARKRHGIELITGRASFEDDRHAVIHGESNARVRFRKVIIACGSVAREHPLLVFDGRTVLRPGEALALEQVPSRLLVIGSGYDAAELATIFSTLGAAVTLAAPEQHLLPDADRDLVRPLERRLKQSLAGLFTGAELASASIDDDGSGVNVTWSSQDGPPPDRFDAVIVALGARPDLAPLRLDALGVEPGSDGWITVDDHLRTSRPRVLAVGDITGPPLLADKAAHQGRIAAEVAAGWESVFDARAIPMVVFTDPQIAWCGLTSAQATAEGIEVNVKKIPWGASGRAVGMGRSEGITRIIYDPDTQLVLGVGIVGPHAAEMIAEGALAIEMGAELADLAATIHPHPTMSELLSDAARSVEP